MQPAKKIPPPPWMTDATVVRLLEALQAGGVKVRFVGGCVRDALQNRPVGDIDVATPETPERVLERLGKAGVHAIPTGIDHGTITAVIGEKHFEITSLRTDVETDGRRARVAFTEDWVQDAARRDFTINALYADADGTIFDPTGGIEDLGQGRVRFVGSAAERIREDALRILRYFRFYARYGKGEPDSEAISACRENKALLAILSGERIAGELLRLMAVANPLPAVKLMTEAGVLGEIFPYALRPDCLARLVALETALGECDSLRRLGALLPADPIALEAIAHRLHLANVQRTRLIDMATPAPELEGRPVDKVIRRLVHRLGPSRLRDRLYLGAAENKIVEPQILLAKTRTLAAPLFPVAGRDVLQRGIARGKEVGLLLREIEEWWIEGDFTASRETLLAELDRRIKIRQFGGN
jgi:poly(A) polymerase